MKPGILCIRKGTWCEGGQGFNLTPSLKWNLISKVPEGKLKIKKLLEKNTQIKLSQNKNSNLTPSVNWHLIWRVRWRRNFSESCNHLIQISVQLTSQARLRIARKTGKIVKVKRPAKPKENCVSSLALIASSYFMHRSAAMPQTQSEEVICQTTSSQASKLTWIWKVFCENNATMKIGVGCKVTPP